ncbi:glycosyltransferase [Limnospira sp. PMC 1243.20]|uniref:glycosyltransferase family protein n=1 Tax=Limnospira sp. PMC 1243.20 TaxID=2981041 RepID=UPI0028E0F0FE|nr:glycosyltransferase [Limnospira sp. PMC 1243.20]MDT9203195.1 glycosyltransferase [Limnospira sp. PMC 1243.20]
MCLIANIWAHYSQQDYSLNNHWVKTLNSELLRVLPIDARVIVEISDRPNPDVKSAYLRNNPECQYWQISPHQDLTKSTICDSMGRIDVLVYGCVNFPDQDFGKLVNDYSGWLKPNGQFIADIPNSQYWRRLVSLPLDKPQLSNVGLSLQEIRSHFNQAGLYIYEVRTKGDRTWEFNQFLERQKSANPSTVVYLKEYRAQTVAENYLVRGIKSSHPPRRLLIQTAIMAPTGCDRIRVLDPDRFSATIPGVRTFSSVRSARIIPTIPQEAKIFIWQRTIMSAGEHLSVLKRLLQENYLIIAEIDDNPLRRREYADHNYFSYRGCHGVQTSTKPLGVFLQQFNPNIAVFPNQLTEVSPPRHNYDNEKISLFFGALNREKDWEPIMASLNKVLSANSGRVLVRVVHDRQFFEALATDQKTFEPFCHYNRYLEILQNSDIALLPLTPTPVNLMKSDLKFLECAGSGVAVLASPTVYELSIQPEKTGLIYRTIREFETQLNRLINNHTLRRQIAENAYNWVKQNRLLCHHYQQRHRWYLEMCDRLPELNRQLQQRVPELFNNP